MSNQALLNDAEAIRLDRELDGARNALATAQQWLNEAEDEDERTWLTGNLERAQAALERAQAARNALGWATPNTETVHACDGTGANWSARFANRRRRD